MKILLYCCHKYIAFALVEEQRHCCFEHQDRVTEQLPERFKEFFGQRAISAVYCASGPGSFYATKSVLAFAEGLCYAYNVPLYCFSTIQAVVWSVNITTSKKKCVVLRVFTARSVIVACYSYSRDKLTDEKIEYQLIENVKLDYLNSFIIGDVDLAGKFKLDKVINHINLTNIVNKITFIKGLTTQLKSPVI